MAELVGETQQKGEKKLLFLSVPRKYSGAKSPLSDQIGSAAHPGVMPCGVQEGRWVKFLCKSESRAAFKMRAQETSRMRYRGREH